MTSGLQSRRSARSRGPPCLHFSKQLSHLEISGLFAAASLVVGISALAAGRLRPRTAILVGGVVRNPSSGRA